MSRLLLSGGKVLLFANKHSVEEPKTPRRRKAPAKISVGRAAPEYPENSEQLSYREQYYIALDTIIS